jgi:hypothetical protein
VVDGSASLVRLNTLEAQLGDIKLINEYIDDPDRVNFRNLILKAFGK